MRQKSSKTVKLTSLTPGGSRLTFKESMKKSVKMGVILLGSLVVFFVATRIVAALSVTHCYSPGEHSDIRLIGLGLFMYAQDHGGELPASLDQLKNENYFEIRNVDAEMKKYFYFPTGKKWAENPEDRIVLLCHHKNGVFIYTFGNSVSYIKIE